MQNDIVRISCDCDCSRLHGDDDADHLPDDTDALKAALIEARAKLVRRRGADRAPSIGDRQDEARDVRPALRAQPAPASISWSCSSRNWPRRPGEDEAKAEAARRPGAGLHAAPRRRGANFPAHLPRRRIVHPAPTCCPCCGGTKLSKIGEDVTETLDVVPRQWFVTEHVREKFSCRSCEKITQPPAPFHAIARGFAGPSLLAMILVDKYANHQPLNRQSEQFAREGIELSVSTMADHVGACAATLMPLYELIKAHVFAAERIHGDDTTVPVLAKVKTRTGRLWTYVRDDRPFGGADPPAAVFFYSPDRGGDPSRAASRRLFRDPSGRRLCRVQRALRAGAASQARSPKRRAGRMRRRKLFELADIASKARDKTAAVDLADRLRGGAEVRCHLRGWSARSTACRPTSALPCAARTSRRWSTISSSG